MSASAEQSVKQLGKNGKGAKARARISFVLLIFLVETILQIFYLDLKLKYFSYMPSTKLLVDTAIWIAIFKVPFFLFAYLFLHLEILKKPVSRVRTSIYHSATFLVILLIVITVAPVDKSKALLDAAILTVISFATVFLLYPKASAFK